MSRNERSRREYERRINDVLDHISARIDEELDLATLAGVACFSPYHFHRVFTSLTGETLGACAKRLRLERAANLLWADPGRTVIGVALDCGFSSHAVFSREFRRRFGVSPSQWRLRKRNHGQGEGNGGKADGGGVPHDGFALHARERSEPMHVEVKDLPELHVAYLRVTGRYGTMERELWERLSRWAGPRGLFGPETWMLGVCHDSPEVTPPDRCRYDACLSLPEGFEPDGEVNTAVIPGGRYAVLRVDGTEADFGPSWHAMFGQWLPGSGWQCDDRPCFERYLGQPDPSGRIVFEICIPVRPL